MMARFNDLAGRELGVRRGCCGRPDGGGGCCGEVWAPAGTAVSTPRTATVTANRKAKFFERPTINPMLTSVTPVLGNADTCRMFVNAPRSTAPSNHSILG